MVLKLLRPKHRTTTLETPEGVAYVELLDRAMEYLDERSVEAFDRLTCTGDPMPGRRRRSERAANSYPRFVVHRRSVVACAFLTLLVALFVAGPAASRQARPPRAVPSSHDSSIRDLEAMLAASPAVMAEHLDLSKVSPLRQPSDPQTAAVLLVLWLAGVLAGWLILQRVSRMRRGRAPPLIAP